MGPAHVRPEVANQDEVTVEDLAAIRGASVRSTRALVARWYAQGTVAVRLRADPGSVRPRYLVSLRSYRAWLERAANDPGEAARAELLEPASDPAIARGCTCVAMSTGTAAGAFVDRACPMHRVLFAA